MTRPAIDPIRLEVIKNALLAITDEMSAALQRSAFSTNIKTRGDFSCAVFDAECRLVAQSFSQPTHLGSLVHSVPSAVTEYGADRLEPGDGIVMNDAHRGAVHLNDVALISPIDVDGARFGYVANVAHHVDVGGSTPGSLGLNREIYQEGLILPPVRLVRGGELDRDLATLIATNIRSPRESMGDFRAQVAANQLAVRRIGELVERIGRDVLVAAVTELLDYTERRVRAGVRDFPHGEYRAVDYLDDDGFGDVPVAIVVTARIDETGVTFDLTECDDQGAGPMNATASMAYSGVAYVLKSLLDPDIPVNDGFYRTVRIASRPGSVVHAVHPAAVAGGWEVCFRVAETAFQALVPALPDRIPAATKGIICNVAFGGIHPDTGYYAFYETVAGGYGAHVDLDGMDGVQPHIHNTENAPVEETELNYPVRIDRFALIEDSGGAGRHRGGLGVRRDYWFVDHEATFSIISDRTRFAPPGLRGGEHGRRAHYVLDPEGEARPLPSKSTTRLRPGQVISVQSPGGGGYGDPRLRDPDRVAHDVRLGKVSPTVARETYGVAVTPDGSVDEVMTARLREATRAPASAATVSCSSGPAAGSLALGVDIGGTFTDAVLSQDGVVIARVKSPTSARDPGIGFAATVERLRETDGLTDESLGLLVHATTVATNAIIEGQTARLALVVTRGFRDVLEIARQIRPDLFDLRRQKPPPLVPRDLVFELDERLGPRGETIRPLDLGSLAATVDAIARLELDGVVVSLLHSYADPVNERLIGAALQEARPDLDVSLSSDVWPEFREYFRTSTTIVNAAVRPIVRRYIGTLIAALDGFDLGRRFFVMQSSGGLMTAETATRLPVHLIESGPAAGLIGASDLGRRMGWHNVISLDIGGTTAKVGLIVDGRPRITHEYEVGAIAASMGGRSKASGYPIRTPVLDLVEIGAGGGSIAWVDPGGALRVGPRSAGAEPGPACYGNGGTAPTLTDANLVLGRIDSDYFLGGEIRLDAAAARQAIADVCATPLGLSVEAAAEGVVSIANANMVRALRLVTVQRGYDPREFVLIAFGGAGPLHANALAVELGIPRVVIPPRPGVFSAAGLLLADVQHLATSTEVIALDSLTIAGLRGRFERLGREAAGGLASQGIAPEGIEQRHYADMRYRGQSYELPIATDPYRDDALERLRDTFLSEHQRQYGHAARDVPIEVVNWKVYAVAPSRQVPAADGRVSAASPVVAGRAVGTLPEAQLEGVRSVRRDDLAIGTLIRGPAIVADVDATTYLEAGWIATRSENDDLILEPRLFP